MSELNCADGVMDNRKWYQKILTIRQADKYNTKRIMLELPLVTISSMDYVKFGFDLCLDIDGAMFAVSIPYLRIWIGKKIWHKYSSLGMRRPIKELR